MGVSFLFSFVFPLLFLSKLFISPPQAIILPFCISFSWGWSWSLPNLQFHEPSSIVLHDCLSDLTPWIYLSLPLYNHKGFDLGHAWMVFPTFFNLSLNLAIRSSWSEPQSAPHLLFADCIKLLHLWLQRINLISVLTIWWCPCVESSLMLLEEGVCYDQCILLAKLY